MLRCVATLLVLSTLASAVHAQIFFSDNFNRADSATLGSPAVGGTWAETEGGTSSARILSNQLNTINGTGNDLEAWGTATTTASFTNLNALAAGSWVEWTFNMRYTRASTTQLGFAANNSYGMAVALTSSGTNLETAAGYAVTFGLSGNARFDLVRYTTGLDGITAGTNSLIAGSTLANPSNFYSVRVRFNRDRNSFELYTRDDGASAFDNPAHGVNTLVGTVSNETDQTSTTGNRMGFYSSYGDEDNVQYVYDNFHFAVAVPEPTTIAMIGFIGAGIAGRFYYRRHKKHMEEIKAAEAAGEIA